MSPTYRCWDPDLDSEAQASEVHGWTAQDAVRHYAQREAEQGRTLDEYVVSVREPSGRLSAWRVKLEDVRKLEVCSVEREDA